MESVAAIVAVNRYLERWGTKSRVLAKKYDFGLNGLEDDGDLARPVNSNVVVAAGPVAEFAGLRCKRTSDLKSVGAKCQ